MISVSSTLEAAARAASRSPISRVTAESVSLDATAITSACVLFTYVTFQKSSSGYWFATCATGSNFYYRKQTAPCTAAEWPCNLGSWTVGNTVAPLYAASHDVAIDGDTIVMGYLDASSDVRIRRSTDASSSWNSFTVSIFPYLNVARQIVIPDTTTVYVCGPSWTGGLVDGWIRIDWNGAAWSITSTHFGTGRLVIDRLPTTLYTQTTFSVWGREVPDYHAISATFVGDPPGGYHGIPGTSQFRIQGRFTCGIDTPNWSPVIESFGDINGDVEFKNVLIGCSREINDYYYSVIWDYYGSKAEPGSLTKSNQFFIGKTNDFIYFHKAPFTIGERIYRVAGFALCEDGDHIVFPATIASGARVYKLPVSSFWGYSSTELDITGDVVDQSNVTYSLDAAARAVVNLDNKDGIYDDSDNVKASSIVRISAGYKTASGNELQQRFHGKISGITLDPNLPDTAMLTVMDSLFNAGFSTGKPHIIRGPNAMFATFDEASDLDLFVPQGGNWFWNSIGSMDDSSRGEETVSFLGSEPSMNQIVIGAIRWRPFLGSGIFEQAVGIAFGGSSEYPDRTYVFRLRNDDLLEFGYINMWASLPQFVAIDSVAYTILPAHSGYTNTTLWFMAVNRCGTFHLYTSTGTSWTLQMSNKFADAEGYPIDGYVGVYHCSNEGMVPTSSAYNPRVLQLLYQSMDLPYTGSDIMKFMGTFSGMESREIPEIEDAFPGAAFSARWNGTGVDGTWTVSGGAAHGAQAAGDPTTIRCDFSESDLVVQCDVEVTSDLAGVIVRADSSISECYAGMVTTSSAEIWLQDGGSWSRLISVPITLADTVRLKFRCFMGFLSLYVDDYMIAITYDETLTSGYVGMVSDGSTSDHDNFFVSGFYIPVEVVVLRPADKPLNLMQQLTEMYDGGHFYCDYDNNLVWGIFDDTTVDLDLAPENGVVITKSTDVSTDQILTAVRVEGDKSYSERRDQDWAMALGMNRYSSVQNAAAQSGAACSSHAYSILNDSHRIRRRTILIKGNPAMEPGDLLQAILRSGDTPKNMLLISFNEIIGPVYEQTISESIPLDVETP